VEIVRLAMTAAATQPPDLQTVNALYHPDHVLTSDWGIEGKTYRGARGFAEAVTDMNATWQEWRQEVDEVLDAGENGVVALMRLVARGRESGAPVEQTSAYAITLRDGKLIATRTFHDRDRAFEFAGLAV
jgi:ketosteroid isomerase-like protein